MADGPRCHYLVTGGCGFIGSHLVDALLSKGHRVTVLDDLSTGRAANLASGARLIEGDIRDPQIRARAIEGTDGVFHLAAIASVQKCIEDWAASSAVNHLASVAVFELAAAAKIPVVYASSAAVYGEQAPPMSEDMPAQPLSPYGADKLAIEQQAAAGASCRELRSCGLRLFNIYGPRQDPASPYSGVIAIFMDRIARGQPVTIFGDGKQTRDFVFVGDVAQTFVRAMADLQAADGPCAEIENVGRGIGVDLITLAKTVGTVTGNRVETVHRLARTGDIRLSASSPPDRFKDILKTDLETGLRALYGSIGLMPASS
ncbi:MAG: NAD-dependent epimerase/dehydratase family protein [Pseudomonadota bacterium]